MARSYLVYSENGKILGVLANKEDKQIFESQRDMSRYEIFKISEDDLMDMMATRDLGYYLSIYESGYIIFPKEEIDMLPTFEMQLDDAEDDIKLIYGRVVTYLKFTEKEKALFDCGMVDMLAMVKQERDWGIFIPPNPNRGPKRYFSIEKMLKAWVEMIDSGILEDDDL